MPTAEFPTRISVAEARAAILALCAARAPVSERIAVGQARARVLAEDIIAAHALPPFANAAMDGYALRATDLVVDGETRLRSIGVALAGACESLALSAGECVRITTGAPLPQGADTVVMKEHVDVDRNDVRVPSGVVVGANVRAAGEDYRAGDLALARARRLRAGDLGVLAALGCTTVEVARQPRVALFSSGDELVAPDRPLGFGQIHDSNANALAALLRDDGIEPARVAHLADDPVAMRDALRQAAVQCDVIVTCGGVSAGEADFMPELVRDLGRIAFWKVRIKPGMPMLCGEISGALVFALPGNPVSAIVTFLALVRPGLLALQGIAEPERRWHARLAAPLHKTHTRTEYLRATLESREDGGLWAIPLDRQGSGMLRGVVEADALIVIPEEVDALGIGAVVEMLPLPGLC